MSLEIYGIGSNSPPFDVGSPQFYGASFMAIRLHVFLAGGKQPNNSWGESCLSKMTYFQKVFIDGNGWAFVRYYMYQKFDQNIYDNIQESNNVSAYEKAYKNLTCEYGYSLYWTSICLIWYLFDLGTGQCVFE